MWFVRVMPFVLSARVRRSSVSWKGDELKVGVAPHEPNHLGVLQEVINVDILE